MQKKDVFFTTDVYHNLTDEQIIDKVNNGDEEALTYILERYKELVNMKVNKYFIIGAEKEDTFQEGMIGLYKAIKNFNKEKQNSFKSFANICIERQLITAIKSSNRQKHIPLNSYLSLNKSAYDNNEDDSVELFETFNNGTIEDPLDTIMKQDTNITIAYRKKTTLLIVSLVSKKIISLHVSLFFEQSLNTSLMTL